MDKFAKRAAVGVAVLIAASVTVAGIALVRVGSKIEQDVAGKPGAAPKVRMAIGVPAEPAPEAEPAPVTAPAVVEAAKQDLASAFGAALGVDVKKHAATQAAAQAPATPTKTTTGSDSLELGFTASSRDAKLGGRDAKALDLRQTGGEKAQLKKERGVPEKLSFENDLGSAR